MDADSCTVDCPRPPLDSQQSTPTNVLNTAAGRFMPDLQLEDRDPISSPDARLEVATPSPAGEVVTPASALPPVPVSGSSCNTEDLLRDDSGVFDDALCEDSSKAMEASQRPMHTQSQHEDSDVGGRDQTGETEQLQAAFSKLSVTDADRAAAAPHGSGNRELKALLSDSVASQVAASAV